MTKRKATIRFFADNPSGVELIVSRGAGVAYPKHTHVSTVTALFVRRGEIVLKRAEGITVHRRGDVLVVEPDTAHSLVAHGAFELLAVCLQRRLFDGSVAAERRESIGGPLKKIGKTKQLRPAERSAIEEILSATAVPEKKSADSIARLGETLIAHPETDASLEEMAGFAHLDKCHLVRKFRLRYGLPPGLFRNQSRIRKIRRELAQAPSLTQASLLAGFYDQSHCIRQFKKHTGLTPREYLAAYQTID